VSGIDRFLARWSRLKRHPAAANAARNLPPLETLAADADLSAYLGEGVEESLRRRALQRIFSDPRLNVMDGLDVYIDDYSIADPIPEAMLAQLNQARGLLFDEEPVGAEDDGQSPKVAGAVAGVSVESRKTEPEQPASIDDAGET